MGKKTTKLTFSFPTLLHAECFMYECFRDRQVTNKPGTWFLTNSAKIHLHYDSKARVWFIDYERKSKTDGYQAEDKYSYYFGGPSYQVNRTINHITSKMLQNNWITLDELKPLAREENLLRQTLKKSNELLVDIHDYKAEFEQEDMIDETDNYYERLESE